jgi:alpha-1,2-mannosyltransferase
MRLFRLAVIVALGIVSVWKCETWKNLPAALRDAAHYHITPPIPHDFFQEWASTRNYAAGRPLYTPQRDTYRREFASLGFDSPAPPTAPSDINPVNAHPPVSVLLFLPLEPATYVTAFRIWSALSLAMLATAFYLIWRELASSGDVESRHTSRLWTFWAVAAGILLVSHPFREQMFNGQLNPPLLLCIVAGWMALRRDRDAQAGVFLGLAAAVKLFPLLLFISPALQRRWRTLLAGAGTFVLATGIAVAVFGAAAYRDYVLTVMPALVVMQTSAYNASLVAFWQRLFDSPGVGFLPVESWMHAPILAIAGIALSATALLAAIVIVHRHVRTREDADLAFATTIVAMLLLSPITWPHGFLVLLLPAILLARRLRGRGREVMNLVYACCLFVLTARPTWWLYRFQTWNTSFVHWTPPGGLWLVTTVALQGYALLGLFALLVASVL